MMPVFDKPEGVLETSWEGTMILFHQQSKGGGALLELPERSISTQNLSFFWLNEMFSKFHLPLDVMQHFAFLCNRAVGF